MEGGKNGGKQWRRMKVPGVWDRQVRHVPGLSSEESCAVFKESCTTSGYLVQIWGR